MTGTVGSHGAMTANGHYRLGHACEGVDKPPLRLLKDGEKPDGHGQRFREWSKWMQQQRRPGVSMDSRPITSTSSRPATSAMPPSIADAMAGETQRWADALRLFATSLDAFGPAIQRIADELKRANDRAERQPPRR
jgi:hypothetical protein